MKFLAVIGNNKLYTFEKNGEKLVTQFIEGSNDYSFGISSISEDIQMYLKLLVNERNLGTTAKLEFEILESADKVVNNYVSCCLKEYISKIYDLDSALVNVIKKLSRDEKLMINTYGINYEGRSYKIENNKLIHGEYDLLSYTIHCEDIINLMDF